MYTIVDGLFLNPLKKKLLCDKVSLSINYLETKKSKHFQHKCLNSFHKGRSTKLKYEQQAWWGG